MMIHSKRIQRESHTAALLNRLVPDNMNKLEGKLALSASVITALLRGILRQCKQTAECKQTADCQQTADYYLSSCSWVNGSLGNSCWWRLLAAGELVAAVAAVAGRRSSRPVKDGLTLTVTITNSCWLWGLFPTAVASSLTMINDLAFSAILGVLSVWLAW